jgi:hypothetical protein
LGILFCTAACNRVDSNDGVVTKNAIEAGADADAAPPACETLGITPAGAPRECGPVKAECITKPFICTCECSCVECSRQGIAGTYQDPNCTCPPGSCQTSCGILADGLVSISRPSIDVDCSSGLGVVTIAADIAYSGYQDGVPIAVRVKGLNVNWDSNEPSCYLTQSQSLVPGDSGTAVKTTFAPAQCQQDTLPPAVNICAHCGAMASVTFYYELQAAGIISSTGFDPTSAGAYQIWPIVCTGQ